MLFASEDEIRRLQYEASQRIREANRTPLDEWHAMLEDEREIRMHRRMRQFAFLLFVAPAIAYLVAALIQWAIVMYVTRTP